MSPFSGTSSAINVAISNWIELAILRVFTKGAIISLIAAIYSMNIRSLISFIKFE